MSVAACNLTAFIGHTGSGARYFAMTFAMRNMGTGCTKLLYLNPQGDSASAAVFAGGGAEVAVGPDAVGAAITSLEAAGVSGPRTCVIVEGSTGSAEFRTGWWAKGQSLVQSAALGVAPHPVLLLIHEKSALLQGVLRHKPPMWVVRTNTSTRTWLASHLSTTPGLTGPLALEDSRAILICPTRGVCVTPHKFADPRLEVTTVTSLPVPNLPLVSADGSDDDDDMFTKT